LFGALCLSPADGRLMSYAFPGEGDVIQDAKHSQDDSLVQIHYDSLGGTVVFRRFRQCKLWAGTDALARAGCNAARRFKAHDKGGTRRGRSRLKFQRFPIHSFSCSK
jgi:hypothetical protein